MKTNGSTDKQPSNHKRRENGKKFEEQWSVNIDDRQRVKMKLYHEIKEHEESFK